MSLISDALKRQEQLRASETGKALREVAAAKPPETSRGSAAPNLAAPAAQPRRVSGPTSPRQRPNPFLERERAAARRPNHSVLLMPILGLIVLLALLLLRHEFVSSPPTAETEVESEKWKVESSADAAVLSDLFPEEAKSQKPEAKSPGGPGFVPAATPTESPKLEAESPGGLGSVPAATPTESPKPEAESPGGPGSVPAAALTEVQKAESSVAIDSNRTQSAAVEANQLPTNAAATPSAAVVEPPPPKAWPAFTLTGIAVGRERLAILSTGEMLLAGEMSKGGVKVEKVNGTSVIFSFGGETKTLRKGEQSDKPADPR